MLDRIEHNLPAYWASYLINGDYSGIEPAERAEIDAWLRRKNLPDPVSCSDESWFGRNDANELAGDVAHFAFLVDSFKDSRHSELAAVIKAAQPEQLP